MTQENWATKGQILTEKEQAIQILIRYRKYMEWERDNVTQHLQLMHNRLEPAFDSLMTGQPFNLEELKTVRINYGALQDDMIRFLNSIIDYNKAVEKYTKEDH